MMWEMESEEVGVSSNITFLESNWVMSINF